MRWFDRNFKFDNLEGTFGGILERLKGTPLRLTGKIHSIPSDQYIKVLDGSWTIQEQVGHLGDLENLWEARFMDFIKGREVLTEADLTNKKTHQSNHNNKNMDDLLNDFSHQRERLCEFLFSIRGKAEHWNSKHPRLLAPMRPIDLAYFIAEHDDHHLARITEIHNQLNELRSNE